MYFTINTPLCVLFYTNGICLHYDIFDNTISLRGDTMASETVDQDNNIHDYLLALDDLGQPKVLDMNVPDGQLSSGLLMVMRLIVMRKGTQPDLPDMGVDIVGRYRFSFEEELTTLTDDIRNQITTYLPELIPVTVECQLDNSDSGDPKRLFIMLGLNGQTYLLIYNTSNNSLKYLTTLEDKE